MTTTLASPLWRPTKARVAQANMTVFMRAAETRWSIALPNYSALYEWSITKPAKFWETLWSFADVIGEGFDGNVLEGADRMPGAKWFPGVRLNFAENLLRRRDDGVAIVFWGEDHVRRHLTWAQLYGEVALMAGALAARGVGPGDPVAGIVANVPEAVVAMLAAASLGAVWSSCSPDFGPQAACERLRSVAPKILFTTDGYYYKGQWFDSLDLAAQVVDRLPSVEQVVIVRYNGAPPRSRHRPRVAGWDEFVASQEPNGIAFKRLPFDHPLYVMFSSGTTGPPKAIVHGAGGTLLQHLKEHRLHCDIRPGDRVFQYTTCGWMMWNWLVSALASEATLVLYDGSPFHPSRSALFDFAEAEGMTHFGASAKYIMSLAKAGAEPRKTHDLARLRVMTATGSPLAPESYDYVYEKVKRDILLASISGGTDIISCFMLGNPIGPVWRGEIQTRGLGMKVEVFDERGRPVRGKRGELVCTAPFPSMPLGFRDDPEGAKYRAAYFEHYPGVWRHGDFVELTDHDGIIVYGRSDAVLNPGGVRIGTAEITREVERLDEVLESLAVGQDWEGDQRVVLFVRLPPGVRLEAELADAIRARLRANLSPRHVPAKVVQVDDFPRTRNGKLAELAVADVIHGRPVANASSLANPQALKLFKNLPELRS